MYEQKADEIELDIQCKIIVGLPTTIKLQVDVKKLKNKRLKNNIWWDKSEETIIRFEFTYKLRKMLIELN